MKELEKFNAETTPLGTELITRDGREVSEWYYFKEDKSDFPIQAIINGGRIAYTIDGNYGKVGEHSKDLFIKPKVNECWVNVYEQYEGCIGLGSPYLTKEDAIKNKGSVSYIKTIRITDEPE